ncbi:MAG: flagellin [Rhodothermales bacterium]
MSAIGDLSRINTNLQALGALDKLQRTNNELGMRQMRLSTGSRINRAEDDTAGYTISKKLEARVRGQAQALSNIGDAKSLLTVAEGSLSTIMDMLQTMKEKAVQAANDTMGTDERTAIENEMEALSAEIDSVLGDTTFNGTALFTSTALSFQVNAESGDTFSVTLGTQSATALGVSNASINVSAATSAANTIGFVDDAITDISDLMASIGDSQKRLTFKQENLTTSMNNYESARSRIADADFAKEQMEIVKLQILQQTGTASLAQANQAPQGILQLIGG